ncbi:elongation of very long chain fatty acids protein F-like [Rhagoletis pomonella]|uniref:elongation of very long chain fatty acids protein F-like n=1 Tax=Rhagoletis pomonella TaxID=28610 RepID=UPI00177ED614|nr:elongation of very long chain fatty acids protein F-like [Rhagoletis pomonella]
MSNIIRTVYDFLTSPCASPEGYKYLPFHGAIWPVIVVDAIFLLYVFRIGPWLMRKRNPYDLRRVLLVYNVFQIVFNSIMIILSILLVSIYINRPGGIGCIERLPYDHPQKGFEIFCGLLYLGNKFLDYLETVFFVLRKSYKQITLLHVYHHIMMTSFVFLYIRGPGSGGHASTVAMINTFVHSVMYVYYLLSSIHPDMKKSLWWKKYITQIQLIQFIIDFIHQIWPLVVRPDCPVPKAWCLGTLTQATIMIILFTNFYIKTYIRKPKPKTNAKKKL